MNRVLLLLFAALAMLPAAAQADEGGALRLSRAEVLARLAASNPAVADALAAVREAEIAEHALDARWSWGLQGSVGYDRSESYPGGSGRGELSTDGTARWSVALGKALPWGTTLGVTLGQFSRSQSVPCSTGSEEGLYIPCLFFGKEKGPIELGPWYTTAVGLTLTQPLWKGGGREVSERLEQQASLEREARRRSATAAVSEASLEALTLYARRSAAEGERNDLRAALERSERLTAMARALVEADQLAAVDLGSFEVREMTLREALLGAEEAERFLGRGLAAVIGAPADIEVVPSEALRQWTAPNEPASALCEEAATVAPRLQELALRRQQADLGVATAEEESRPSLDLTGSFSPSGTSDGWGGSFGDAAALEARGYGAAVTLSMPLDDTAASARREQAALLRDRLARQQASAGDALCRQVTSTRDQLAGIAARRQLATERAARTEALVTSREAKFAAGYGTMEELFAAIEAHEQSLAALRRLALDEELAQLQLLAARGRLLTDLADAGHISEPALP